MRISAERIFLFTFALLTVFGMTYERKKEYIFNSKKMPVFFHTFYEENSESCGKVDLEVQTAANENSSFPKTNAKSCAVLSLDTGELVYGESSDIALPFASTTKIMTALTVLQSSVDLDSVFTVPREVVGVEGSSIYLYEGEKIYVRDLLYGLLLESGNDAAVALALCCSDSVENFVALMNENARKMGLTKTTFKNPHGLYTDDHLTTAYELGRITVEAMKNPIFQSMVSTKSYRTTPVSEQYPVHFFSNHNRLLRTLEGAVGVKTGYTILAGRCLVSATVRDGTGFAAVTLNDRNDWNDHTKLHEYAHENYKAVKPIKKSELLFCYGDKVYTNSEDSVILVNRKARKIDKIEILLKPKE